MSITHNSSFFIDIIKNTIYYDFKTILNIVNFNNLHDYVNINDKSNQNLLIYFTINNIKKAIQYINIYFTLFDVHIFKNYEKFIKNTRYGHKKNARNILNILHLKWCNIYGINNKPIIYKTLFFYSWSDRVVIKIITNYGILNKPYKLSFMSAVFVKLNFNELYNLFG
jgi:hypothetical protein